MPEKNFRWIIPGKLAASHRPLPKDLESYSKLGINTVVCLQTWEVNDIYGDYDTPSYKHADVKKLGMKLYHMPIPDGMPPLPEQFDNFIRLVDKAENVVVVHCYAGIGRTGCMAAAYLGHDKKLNGNEAVEALRKLWICYIQTPEQELATKEYLDNKISKN